jgi:arsenate reductase-like glutaredoxin family protein
MKLVNLVPGKELKKQVVKEALDDMDATLPTQVERFLNKLIDQIRGYNLSKRKEQLVIAKIIDALGLDKQQLMQAVQKIKKNDILKK